MTLRPLPSRATCFKQHEDWRGADVLQRRRSILAAGAFRLPDRYSAFDPNLPNRGDKGMNNTLAEELMDEVREQMKGRSGDIVKFCTLFDRNEIDIVIGRLENALSLHISEYSRGLHGDAVRTMIEILKTVSHTRIGPRLPKRRFGR
jgi:hypothetical protein